jgi:hypothetical protein
MVSMARRTNLRFEGLLGMFFEGFALPPPGLGAALADSTEAACTSPPVE